MNAGIWNKPAWIAENHFVNKSLSCWSFNVAVGCAHACRFCYVPDVSTIKLKAPLANLGVRDPDAEWGDYVFVRRWDEKAFRQSLRRAEKRTDLNPDGNRAVMLCTTTDPYQTLPGEAHGQLQAVVRRGLEMILKESTINVRILTRSPLARRDFDLMKQFGPRLMFGISLPTVNNRLARVYEPHAPAPSRRLETLRLARDCGLNIYVAVAPTYPEMDETDFREVFHAINPLRPLTIFHEPINIRAENVARIRKHAAACGFELRDDVWASKAAWAEYAVRQLIKMESWARIFNCKHALHLWPDKDLLRPRPDLKEWFEKYWNRISEWPK